MPAATHVGAETSARASQHSSRSFDNTTARGSLNKDVVSRVKSAWFHYSRVVRLTNQLKAAAPAEPGARGGGGVEELPALPSKRAATRAVHQRANELENVRPPDPLRLLRDGDHGDRLSCGCCPSGWG
jgi:hypothetical protein